jgi:hypothetical protein
MKGVIQGKGEEIVKLPMKEWPGDREKLIDRFSAPENPYPHSHYLRRAGISTSVQCILHPMANFWLSPHVLRVLLVPRLKYQLS